MIKYIATIDQGGSTGNEWYHMDEIDQIPSGAKLIEYINLMCIVKRGHSFTLKSSWRYNSCTYTENFWGDTYRLTRRKQIRSSIDNEIEQLIAGLPSGIKCTTQLAELPSKLTKERYLAMSPHIEYMRITYSVSEEYSSQIYETRNKLLKNTGVLVELAEHFGKAVYQYKSEDKDCSFKFSKTSVSYPPYGSKCDLSYLGMTSFPDDFICFCFADVLAHYILENKKDSVNFHEIVINWQRLSSYNQYHLDDTWVSIRISYSRHYDDQAGLQKWV